jgi:tRNA-intron endonuclease
MTTVSVRFSNKITLSETESTQKLAEQGYGTLLQSGKLQLSLLETLYLHEKNQLSITDGRKKSLTTEQIERKAERLQHDFWVRYAVFKDLRNRGYVVKTGFKYGADFSVYDRGVKPGQDHSRWIVYPVHEGKKFSWHDFSAKNRIAHSTKKRLMLGIVDDECSVTYFEIRWMRP